MIDKDNEDFVRAIRKAAYDDEICGLFFLSNLDFEFGNFNLDEMAEIIAEYAKEIEIENIDIDDIKKSIYGSTSGKELMKKVKSSFPELTDISKGEDWGRLLMGYAARNSRYRENGSAEETQRPIIEIVNMLLRSLHIGYRTTRKNYTVSQDTGKLTDRLQQSGSD